MIDDNLFLISIEFDFKKRWVFFPPVLPIDQRHSFVIVTSKRSMSSFSNVILKPFFLKFYRKSSEIKKERSKVGEALRSPMCETGHQVTAKSFSSRGRKVTRLWRQNKMANETEERGANFAIMCINSVYFDNFHVCECLVFLYNAIYLYQRMFYISVSKLNLKECCFISWKYWTLMEKWKH